MIALASNLPLWWQHHSMQHTQQPGSRACPGEPDLSFSVLDSIYVLSARVTFGDLLPNISWQSRRRDWPYLSRYPIYKIFRFKARILLLLQ